MLQSDLGRKAEAETLAVGLTNVDGGRLGVDDGGMAYQHHCIQASITGGCAVAADPLISFEDDGGHSANDASILNATLSDDDDPHVVVAATGRDSWLHELDEQVRGEHRPSATIYILYVSDDTNSVVSVLTTL